MTILDKPLILDTQLLDEVSQKAVDSHRSRGVYTLHERETDKTQKMLNAIEPGSYIQPHRHTIPPKEELVLLIRGKGAVVCFDRTGNVTEIYPLDTNLGQFGVEVPAGVFHTLISISKSTVFLEIKKGPFNPDMDKHYAYWAPDETSEDGSLYLKLLEEEVIKVFAETDSDLFGDSSLDDHSVFAV